MQTVADMRGVGVKNRGKSADVLCGRPLVVMFLLKITVLKFHTQRPDVLEVVACTIFPYSAILGVSPKM